MKKLSLVALFFCTNNLSYAHFAAHLDSRIVEILAMRTRAITLVEEDEPYIILVDHQDWLQHLPAVEVETHNYLREGRLFALCNQRIWGIPYGPTNVTLQYQGSPSAWHFSRLYPRTVHPLTTVKFWDSNSLNQIRDHFDAALIEARRFDIPQITE